MSAPSSSHHDTSGESSRRRRRGRAPSSPPHPSSSSSAAGGNNNNNGVWPEPFLEALATRVAIDAFLSLGRLAAAMALNNLFQVCSTWRAVSRSDRLWRRLTRRIWARDVLTRDTWQEEYMYQHRTASNFHAGRYLHTVLDFDDANSQAGIICRCIALSDTHLAAGFADGAVRVFLLRTLGHTRTLHPRDGNRNRLGPFSRAVSGIILSRDRLVFASLDGDIHVSGNIDGRGPARRAIHGDVLTDGALVDFTGFNRWWVGLHAGVPGRSFHVWDASSEEVVYTGGTLTDPEALPGWHLLTELAEFVGRVRAASRELAVACTSGRVITFELLNGVLVVREEAEYPRGVVPATLDARNGAYVVANSRGEASVRRADSMEEVCRIVVGGRVAMGCMNTGYVLMCAGGTVRVWEAEQGLHLYNLTERVGLPYAMAGNDRHVAACADDTSLHLWDFGGAQ